MPFQRGRIIVGGDAYGRELWIEGRPVDDKFTVFEGPPDELGRTYEGRYFVTHLVTKGTRVKVAHETVELLTGPDDFCETVELEDFHKWSEANAMAPIEEVRIRGQRHR